MVRIAFAGDRQISVEVLSFLLARGVKPLVLLIPEHPSHGKKLRELCGYLPPEDIQEGRPGSEAAARLGRHRPMYLVAVHYPHLFPPEILTIPSVGAVNLHPAFLPYNRGWNTPSWAILDGTPVGATLHFMAGEVDSGDIIHQREVAVAPEDTAHTLYQKLLAEEIRVFTEAWPLLLSGKPPRKPNAGGTSHRKADLESVREITDSEGLRTLKRIRALTTSDLREAAYIREGGRRYLLRIEIVPEGEGQAQDLSRR